MRHVIYLALIMAGYVAAFWLAQTDDDLYMPFSLLALFLIYFLALHGQLITTGRDWL